MTAEFLKHLDDDLQEQRMRELWQQWGLAFIAALVFILIGVGGYSWYTVHQNRIEQAEATKYFAAESAKATDNETTTQLQTMLSEGPGGLRALAGFKLAQGQMEGNKFANAEQTYLAMSNDSAIPTEYRDIATIMLAQLQAAHNPKAAQDTLTKLVNAGSPYSAVALELAATISIGQKDYTAADAALQRIQTLKNVPNDLRKRAQGTLDNLHAMGDVQ